MHPHGMRRVLLSAALAFPLTLASARALAGESLEVASGTTAYIDGTVRYRTVTVRSGGTLRVRSVGSGGTGTLTLKAEQVVVEQGGAIDATGAGYSGTSGDGGTPGCCPAAAGAAGPADKKAPGGGGGNGGKGAAGCPGGGKGGEAYANLDNAYPGAAGGASSFGAPMSGIPNAGGRGGGSILILAASVTVDGDILADGAPGVSYGGVGSGAGAGGVIRIDAWELHGTGKLSARGGDGAQAYAGIGGGGGGGVIHVSLPADAAVDALPASDATGGLTGTGTCAAGEAGPDDLELVDAKPCTDADGDGHGAAACGGDDCDDADPGVHGGADPAIEICDGQDNDCDGAADNDLVADACPEGQACQAGACVDDGAGGAGGGAEPPPDHLDYRGACDIGPQRTAHLHGAAFFGAALAGFLAALRLRRRRPR